MEKNYLMQWQAYKCLSFLFEAINWIAETEETKMSGEKSIFEQMDGTYTEIDGILYPNIRVGQEETKAEQDTFWGKYGDEKVSERKPAGEILSSGLFRAVETKSGRNQ